MKSLAFKTYSLIIVILSIAGSSIAADGLKTHTLEGKINDISILRAKIIDKIDQAIEMRHYLKQRVAELRVEIRSEQISAEVYNHQAALQNLRIRYNLSLIQRLQAYIDLINERINYFQTGNARLKFLIDQIHDDLAIIDILEDMQIKNLIDRIDLVLNEFNPEMQKPIINVAHMRLLPTEYVWENICLKAN
ncbi:MAG: hypothetical protein PVI38_06815 [Desulfobacterales bacterium]|jgi:hypothetical protein